MDKWHFIKIIYIVFFNVETISATVLKRSSRLGILRRGPRTPDCKGVYVLIMRKGKPRVAGAGDKDQPSDISISLTLSTNLWTLDVSQETGELYQGSKIKVIRIIII